MAKSTQILEKERRANDLLRVYNPTDEDYVVEWDRKNGTKKFRVPAKSEEVLVRYIAEKFIKEMYFKIITEKSDKAVIEENKRRVSKGMAKMTSWKEQPRFESKHYDPGVDEARKLISVLYVGVEREFGIDAAPASVDKGVKEDKPVFEVALDDVKSGEEKEAPPAQFECDFPGCNFSTDTRIALHGHKRSHRDQIVNAGVEEKKKKAVKGVSS